MRTYQTAIPSSCFNFPTTLRKKQRNAWQVSSPSAVSSRNEFFRTLANWRLGSHRRLFTLLFPQQRVASRRRWNGASVNSRQVTGRPIYNETSTAPRSSQSRAREKGGVSKFSLSRKLITECRLRRSWNRRWRRWLGGYFPGNSSRGRLARGLRLGSTRVGLLQPTPSTSFASNFSNTRDTLWALAQCFDETPYKWRCLE